MADLLLRLEQDGAVLGEWRLGDPPLKLNIVDSATGKVLATMTAEVPIPSAAKDVAAADNESTIESASNLMLDALMAPVESVSKGVFYEPTTELPCAADEPRFTPAVTTGEPPETEEMDERHTPRRDLNRIDPERIEFSTTQEGAPFIGLEDTASAPRLIPSADLESVTSKLPDVYREPTEGMGSLDPDSSGALPELSLDPNSHAPAAQDRVDELPVEADDPGPLARHPGDDFTLPLPVSEHTVTGTGEATGELGDSLTADLIEVEGRAEVWSRRAGEWVLKGSLVPGQRARMKDGSVKCLPDGGLMVTPGPVMRGTADVPGGGQVQMKPGAGAKRFPAGTSVTLWNGERALYVRSDQPMVDVAPVEYHSGRSMSVPGYQPPKSDLESSGHGDL